MENTKPWYKKKRFIIPGALVALFIGLGIIGSHNQPAVQSSTQTTAHIQETTTTPTPVVAVPAANSTEIQSDKSTAPAPTASTQSKTTTSTQAPVTKTTQTQSSFSNDNYYQNADGNTVHSPAYTADNSVPAGATAQCGDGTYSFSQNHSGTCSHHNGVATWY